MSSNLSNNKTIDKKIYEQNGNETCKKNYSINNDLIEFINEAKKIKIIQKEILIYLYI